MKHILGKLIGYLKNSWKFDNIDDFTANEIIQKNQHR